MAGVLDLIFHLCVCVCVCVVFCERELGLHGTNVQAGAQLIPTLSMSSSITNAPLPFDCTSIGIM